MCGSHISFELLLHGCVLRRVALGQVKPQQIGGQGDGDCTQELRHHDTSLRDIVAIRASYFATLCN